MNKYELLEKIRSICEIPVVVVGAEVNCAVISECLCRGVEFYLKKPLKKGLLENLWQFTARRQGDFHSKIDTNPPEKKYSITHTQSPVDFFNRTKKNNAVKIEDPGEYEGENFESEYKKEPELIYSEMQNELRQTDELSHGDKRKERGVTDAGSDLGDQKKPKLIPADDLQCRSLEAVPDVEEATNGRKEPFKSVFEIEEKLELACKEKELLAEWSTHPVTNFAAYVGYEFEEREFQPLESVGECMGHHETPLSPQESSNKDVIGKQQMKKTDIALDEELMQDGISLWDLEFDMQEVQSYAPDLEKKANQELFNEIFTDLANELKP